METNPVPQMEQPKSNRNLIIGIVVAVVLCCCCVVTGLAGYYGYQAYLEAQRVAQEIQQLDIPTEIPFNPIDPQSTDVPIPDFDVSGDVPQGGLADESTRYTAWLSVQIVGAISGCTTPTTDGTTIAVVQQPDGAGVWKEEWTVNCGDGSFKPYTVTFTPENGIVNVTVDVPTQ
ncbi:MAG TPA: hypothetical protein PK078_03690 [Anaerolineales bacterium]|nr:hypothetical protein [Anaerolineales bacterium]HNA90215.1 hypothetical protein [Anaerolineales bacterium]HNB37132.1 hypothetical protein [Anaerolineales bacterium]HNC07809.1 hypothetical protein [Anaerolineales bacterium]